MLKETLLTFAVEVGTSCFGGICIGQVRIKTNFRPSSLVLKNLVFLECEVKWPLAITRSKLSVSL